MYMGWKRADVHVWLLGWNRADVHVWLLGWNRANVHVGLLGWNRANVHVWLLGWNRLAKQKLSKNNCDRKVYKQWPKVFKKHHGRKALKKKLCGRRSYSTDKPQ